MTGFTKPSLKPANPNFSSGPCSKRPGYDVNNLDISTLGRSHRAAIGKDALGRACSETARLLGLPEGYRVGIVPASDTGAVEMALWSLLGARPVDVFAWESFGSTWVADILNQLKLDDVNHYHADYGLLPDMSQANPKHDVVFTWNGTTAGVKVPNADWIADDREGLTICDATSAVFAMDMPWEKLDVVTYSWQKVLGGEGAHGMLILSPKAVERLESYTPAWPLPKIFRLTKKGKLVEGIFRGETINTPSMLCVADYLDALAWVDSLGGLQGAIDRSQANLAAIEKFVAANDWIDFLAQDPNTLSNTSVCLKLNATPEQVKAMIKLLADENVAFDIGAYRDAPDGLRIWCGATVEASDVEALMSWLSWAYQEVQ
ncbi:phosphoserine aminotransferase [Oleiphilus sp. HI0009]|uniref:phosphoserine transaminase n=1 Tax=unclassified Oleiphilus TaxID=2631174 RepID=UPI0007C222C8|nr:MULTISPECIES: phosphoserine transaminase [unclassified Oleiphilus]KZX82204.1 phosphoserine aminotransferase [Oleiphilus sp. HI0009]KZY69211.1 phosphoserine aminotransferase [Oleiphilus sp. HI0066]KZY69733.1 phosphoserine aminotransferase [Oleiphilus sp. HI0067]MCH2158441.1 phosphoserine transaminase [Oleiphilaceae bacterium]